MAMVIVGMKDGDFIRFILLVCLRGRAQHPEGHKQCQCQARFG